MEFHGKKCIDTLKFFRCKHNLFAIMHMHLRKMNDKKYSLLIDVIKKDILAGKYSSGQLLPSVRAMMRRFKVSSATAQRAFEELTKQGMIAGRRGSGTVVTKLGASRKIGLIVPGVAYSEFFSLVVDEISRCATRDGYVLLLGNMSSSRVSERVKRAKKFAKELVKENVAGVIYQPFEFVENAEKQNREIVSVFDKAGIPVVLLSCDIEPPPGRSKFDVVGINNMDAGYRLGNHLLSVGARKIDFLLRPNTAPSGRNRMRGVITAINMAVSCEGVKKGHRFRVLNAEPDNLSALKRHLRGGKPDAFVCSGDISAAKFKQTLEKAGLQVPSDVLLAGFNDLQMASLLTPPLTTIHQPCKEIGAMAFRLLMMRLTDRDTPPLEMFLPAPLKERESTRLSARGR